MMHSTVGEAAVQARSIQIQQQGQKDTLKFSNEAVRSTPSHSSDDSDKNGMGSQAIRTLLDKQMRKTKLCHFHQNGLCKFGNSCAFAHETAELQSAPNLRKTRLCKAFAAGHCPDANCGFAHGQEELRATPLCYKTSICVWYAKGKCMNGNLCRFAHGRRELRVESSADGHEEQGSSPLPSPQRAQRQEVAQPRPQPPVGAGPCRGAPIGAGSGFVSGGPIGRGYAAAPAAAGFAGELPSRMHELMALAGRAPVGAMQSTRKNRTEAKNGEADALTGSLHGVARPFVVEPLMGPMKVFLNQNPSKPAPGLAKPNAPTQPAQPTPSMVQDIRDLCLRTGGAEPFPCLDTANLANSLATVASAKMLYDLTVASFASQEQQKFAMMHNKPALSGSGLSDGDTSVLAKTLAGIALQLHRLEDRMETLSHEAAIPPTPANQLAAGGAWGTLPAFQGRYEV